ncbi:esterase/lipase family protein [Arthrobacter sp. 7Tela_A1]|uniref:esterase/lipase family protein n=1 Tax=Arthrobacter sp. 7Tela_A1 TaxID=3093745 RepID=UPI003BB54BA2
MTRRPSGEHGAGRRAGLGGWLRRRTLLAAAWAADYAYVARWQIQGFWFRLDPAAYLHPEEGMELRQPVLLLPGVYETWQFLRPLAEFLSARGHPVHTVRTLGYNRGSVPDMARRVEEYLAAQDLSQVAIVAHSKGGLIGKQVMLGEQAHRVSRMVAVNTPFSGSPYASLFLVPSIRAFSPRDRRLRTLMASLDVNARITSVYASFDPHIPGGSGLDGARNIVLDAMGHFRPVADPELHGIVAQELDRAGSPPGPAGSDS